MWSGRSQVPDRDRVFVLFGRLTFARANRIMEKFSSAGFSAGLVDPTQRRVLVFLIAQPTFVDQPPTRVHYLQYTRADRYIRHGSSWGKSTGNEKSTQAMRISVVCICYSLGFIRNDFLMTCIEGST